MNDTDTIAAIATAPGEAGLSVVRVSGPDTFAIADRIFRCRGLPPSKRQTGTFVLGHVWDRNEIIDEAILLIMRAPNSYTCDDVIELQGHGGNQCARRILRSALHAGARLADPGEFTQRAFLNGRLDLVQAEAVLDIIHARSERAAAAALDQLRGRLSQHFDALYDALIRIAADLEGTLDFPEDELPETIMPEIIQRGRRVLQQFNDLIDSWEEGHLLRDGARVVISGKPNVGKSTLLNGLLGHERAIVSSTPGTTRDTIEEDLVINGIPIRVIDTAGLRETECEIEQIGIRRTRDFMEKADLHIVMLDATQPVEPAEETVLSTLRTERSLVLINKTDLTSASSNLIARPDSMKISATEDIDIERVRRKIADILSARIDLEARPHATISERHRKALANARDELIAVLDMLQSGTEDITALASSQVRGVLDQLGTVTGRAYHDELLTQIFSRFCIGK